MSKTKPLTAKATAAVSAGDANGEEIVATLSRQLSWSHFLALLPVKNPLARDFYAQMCSLERWSVRTLRERVDSMLFECTALSKKPDELIRLELDALQARGDVTPPLVLKDPYVLDFLDLDDRYLEKGLEDAVLRDCACAGWPSTTRSRATCRRWASSCARARCANRSSCWSWTSRVSMWPST